MSNNPYVPILFNWIFSRHKIIEQNDQTSFLVPTRHSLRHPWFLTLALLAVFLHGRKYFPPDPSFHLHISYYRAKCANARLASAMRWVSSFFLYAAPSEL